MAKNKGKCSVKGCPDPAKCKGMCMPHYKKHYYENNKEIWEGLNKKRRKLPWPAKVVSKHDAIEIVDKNTSECAILGCNLSVYATGLCRKHYQKQRYNGRKIERCVLTPKTDPAPTLIRKDSKDFVPFEERDRESHIRHETPIFALALGRNYKSIPPVLTIDNYESERTVGNFQP